MNQQELHELLKTFEVKKVIFSKEHCEFNTYNNKIFSIEKIGYVTPDEKYYFNELLLTVAYDPDEQYFTVIKNYGNNCIEHIINVV